VTLPVLVAVTVTVPVTPTPAVPPTPPAGTFPKLPSPLPTGETRAQRTGLYSER